MFGWAVSLREGSRARNSAVPLSVLIIPVLRILSGFGPDPDPTSTQTKRDPDLLNKIEANFKIIKFVMPQTFFYSQIIKFI
jgi:hypothetical protein